MALPPFLPGTCIRSLEELRAWLEKTDIQIVARDGNLFAYSAGTLDGAVPDDRDKSRILFDSQGRYLGLALYIPDVQNWSLPGVPGELKTVVRSESTVAEDMEAKCLFGWFAWHASTGGAPDLRPVTQTVTVDVGTVGSPNVKTSAPFTPTPSPFFSGTAPDWDIYTVCKLA